MPRHQTSHDRALPAAVLGLVVLSFLPAGWLAPVSWFGDLLSVVAAPIAQPARTVGGWLAPASGGPAEPEEIAQLRRQLDEYRTLYERARARNDDLLDQMEQLGLLRSLNPSISTKLLNAPVIGSSADVATRQLLIRGGTSQGVQQNDVVAVAGVQLFGSVRDASAVTSWIMPITARAQERIEGIVMVDDERRVACSLAPVGDGTLRGDVAYDDADPEASASVAVGQTVRLADGTWAPSAQMLVLGTVESVEPAPDSPLRRVIVVRPTVALERVTEVIVRVGAAPGGEDGS